MSLYDCPDCGYYKKFPGLCRKCLEKRSYEKNRHVFYEKLKESFRQYINMKGESMNWTIEIGDTVRFKGSIDIWRVKDIFENKITLELKDYSTTNIQTTQRQSLELVEKVKLKKITKCLFRAIGRPTWSPRYIITQTLYENEADARKSLGSEFVCMYGDAVTFEVENE